MRITGLLIALFAVLLVGCGESPVEFHGKDITGVMDDLSFTLTDENGDTVNESIVDDKAVVLFFGYTHCPDFCPMTLTLLAQAMNTLSEQEREQLRVLFVSVDPERDTPALLKEYTEYFGPEVIGLTGDKDQLDDVTSATAPPTGTATRTRRATTRCPTGWRCTASTRAARCVC